MTTETKCDCGAGGHDHVHLAHCATRQPKADEKCTCSARYNGGLHEPTCAVIQSEPLTAALHAHIQNLAARPLELRMLIELEKTCLLARELMAIGKHPSAAMRRGMIHSPNIGMGDDYGMPMPIQSGFGAMQAISSPNETFGVTAIRELVAGLAALNKPPEPSPILKDMQDTITRLEKELKEALKPTIKAPLEEAS